MEKDKSKNCEINWFFINEFFEDARTFRTAYNKDIEGIKSILKKVELNKEYIFEIINSLELIGK